MIGPPGLAPQIAVPTHFSKVILGVRNDRKDQPGETALGSFVLPNARIPDTALLEGFAVPGMLHFSHDMPLEILKSLQWMRWNVRQA